MPPRSFWWARNQLYFDQGLDRHDGMRVLRYERVRRDPGKVIESLSSYIGVPLPVVATRRVRAPRTPAPAADLHPRVAAFSDEMWDVLRRMSRAVDM